MVGVLDVVQRQPEHHRPLPGAWPGLLVNHGEGGASRLGGSARSLLLRHLGAVVALSNRGQARSGVPAGHDRADGNRFAFGPAGRVTTFPQAGRRSLG